MLVAGSPTTSAARLEVEAVLRDAGLSIVFHPVIRLESGGMLGTEALARLASDPTRSPRDLFAQAAECGLQTELEVLAVRRALIWLRELPDDAFLFVNATPSAIVSPAFHAVIPDDLADRIIIDLSVEAVIESYAELVASVRDLRARGARISIDDAGDDRASWARINRLEPEVIKLGPETTRNLMDDARARAVARHFLAFAADIHADVIAEAIETPEERDLLIDLGVKFGQGYLYGRPAALEIHA